MNNEKNIENNILLLAKVAEATKDRALFELDQFILRRLQLDIAGDYVFYLIYYHLNF